MHINLRRKSTSMEVCNQSNINKIIVEHVLLWYHGMEIQVRLKQLSLDFPQGSMLGLRTQEREV